MILLCKVLPSIYCSNKIFVQKSFRQSGQTIKDRIIIKVEGYLKFIDIMCHLPIWLKLGLNSVSWMSGSAYGAVAKCGASKHIGS